MNILGATAPEESMEDCKETWVITERKDSVFTWDFRKHTGTLDHSKNCLPELEIQAGFSNFVRLHKRVTSISKYSKINFN